MRKRVIVQEVYLCCSVYAYLLNDERIKLLGQTSLSEQWIQNGAISQEPKGKQPASRHRNCPIYILSDELAETVTEKETVS